MNLAVINILVAILACVLGFVAFQLGGFEWGIGIGGGMALLAAAMYFVITYIQWRIDNEALTSPNDFGDHARGRWAHTFRKYGMRS